MTVSVVIPAYNCAAHLEHVLESIKGSGLRTTEILIVNDGSTDDTESVALQLQDRYRDVRVITQPNSGVSAARNRGIRESNGDYIFFVDADDSLVPGSLDGIDSVLDDQLPDMLLFGMVFDYYKFGKVYRSDEMCYPDYGIVTSSVWAPAYKKLFEANMLSPIWNKLIRRDLILSDQLSFREDMIEMEDMLFSVQCLLHSERIYLLNRVVYRYRQAEDERGTFRRLWRIDRLSKYMRPFYETAEALEKRFAACEIACPAITVSDQIYVMLFQEKLRFAALAQTRSAALEMLSGEHSDAIERMAPKLYRDLQAKRYVRVWGKRVLGRARHQLAILVKYTRRMKELK